MVQEDLDYIDKQECIRRGFTPKANGGFYKQNALEKLESDGYLDFGNKRYSSSQRVKAGFRFAKDYKVSRVDGSGVVNLEKIRVDGSGNSTTPESVSIAEDNLRKAIRVLPREYRKIIYRVCCEDKELVLVEKSERKRTQEKHRQAMILCLGLDRLVEHYRR